MVIFYHHLYLINKQDIMIFIAMIYLTN